MTEPIMTGDELKNFIEGYKSTLELVVKHRDPPDELSRNNSALIQVISIYHLKKSSKRLEESSMRVDIHEQISWYFKPPCCETGKPQ